MAAIPVKPYEGKEPDIFISYSHRDSDRVFPILKHLADEGFRVWYDEGIDPGTEWPESIATHLAGSTVCIAFVSAHSLLSQNCRREINFALSRNHIGFLSVMLEDAKMTPGVEMQLSTYQSLLMYKYPTIQSFYEKLDRVDLLQPCRKATGPETAAPGTGAEAVPVNQAAAGEKPAPGPETVPAANSPEQKEGLKLNPKTIGIAAAVLAVLVLVLVLVLGGRSKKPSPAETDTAAPSPSSTAGTEASSSEKPGTEAVSSSAAPDTAAETDTAETSAGSETAPEPAVTELSDKLSDYTFRLDGVVYQLPFAFEQIEKNGWTIASSGVSSQSEVEAGKDLYFRMMKNGRSVTVYAVNPGEEARAVADCPIGGIEVQQSNLAGEDIFCTAGEVTPYMGRDEVTAAFGNAADLYTGSDYAKLTYGFFRRICTVFTLYPDSPKYNSIAVFRYPSAPPAARKDALSDSLSDYTFMLDGVFYQLPFAFTKLTDNGWTISTSGYSDKTLISGYSTDGINMVKNGNTLYFRVFNVSGNAKAIADCLITSVTAEQYSLQDLSVFSAAQGIGFPLAEETLIKAFGEGSRNDYADYSTFYYTDSDSAETRFRVYTKDAKFNEIQLSYMDNAYLELTEISTEEPDYLAGYTAPAELGSDPTSGCIEIEGDLYGLPAPVSSFLNNGWAVRSKSGFVSAFCRDSMILERDGITLDVSIVNYADYQTTAENCAVYKVRLSAENGINASLPGGIAIGAPGSVFSSEPGASFTASDYSSYTQYSLYDRNSIYSIRINVGKESGNIELLNFEKTVWDH